MAGLVEGLILLLFRDAGGSYRSSSRLWQPGLSLWFDDGGLEQFRIPFASTPRISLAGAL